MSDRLIRLENFRAVCKERGLGATELSALLGSRYTYWRDLLSGNKESFGEKIARRIEDGLDLPRGWLDHPPSEARPVSHLVLVSDGHQPVSSADPPADSHKVRNVRRVWVVGAAQGGMPERIWGDGDYPVGATDAYVEASTIDQHAFVCRVVGDSMASRYMPGEYFLVEPNTPIDIEDDVLVRLKTGETLLKRLNSRRGWVRLGSYNRPEVLSFTEDEIDWMYYVVQPIPAKRLKHRV